MSRLDAAFRAGLVRAVLIPFEAAILLVAWCGAAMWTKWSRRKSEPVTDRRIHVVVIATFYNANWCIAHLAPIAAAPNVASVTAIVDGPVAALPRVKYVFPPRTLARVLGRIAAKLVQLMVVVAHDPCDVVIGYFLVPNGLAALAAARLFGCKAVYQNTVGMAEIVGGGADTDNRVLQQLGRNSWLLERLAYALVRQFDAVVVRGEKAVQYLQSNHLTHRPQILLGSVDCTRFAPRDMPRCYDVVTVARLVEIKQPQVILEVIKKLRFQRPDVCGVIVGDGPLYEELKRRAEQLGLNGNLKLLGQVDDVEEILARAKIFLLTSRSEGLAIALAEAMACGVPAVVSDVGELSTLVVNGATGWRVPVGDADAFAARCLELLDSPAMWQRFSDAARQRAMRTNGREAVAAQWGSLLEAVVRA